MNRKGWTILFVTMFLLCAATFSFAGTVTEDFEEVYDFDSGGDVIIRMEWEAERLERKAERLEEKAEDIEDLAEDLERIAEGMKETISELRELDWFYP